MWLPPALLLLSLPGECAGALGTWCFRGWVAVERVSPGPRRGLMPKET